MTREDSPVKDQPILYRLDPSFRQFCPIPSFFLEDSSRVFYARARKKGGLIG